MKNLNIFYKALFSISLILIFFALAFVIGSFINTNIYDSTVSYYESSHKVTTASSNIISNINNIHSATHTMLEQENSESILYFFSVINEHEKAALNNLYILESSFTGSKTKISQLRLTLLELFEINQTLGNSLLSNQHDVGYKLHEQQQPIITVAVSQSEELLLVAEYEAEKTLALAEKNYLAQRRVFLFTGILSIILAVFISYLLSISLSKPMRKLVKEMKNSNRPDYTPKLDTQRKDEIGVLSKTFSNMLDSLQSSYNEKMEMELRQRNTHKLESLGIMASGIAHEINNPINGIMNYSQIILDETDKSSDTNLYATEIISESERISKIVKSLLDFSRIESNTYSKISLPNLMARVESLINILIKKDNINFSINTQENLPKLMCNPLQIQQVLINLLTNSRSALNEKFESSSTNKTMTVNTESFTLDNEAWIRISVVDNGPGIPDDLKDLIYDPFFTTKPRDRGTGLGLSISYGIIQDHDGKIYYETVIGEGTKFIIELPVEGKNNHEKNQLSD